VTSCFFHPDRNAVGSCSICGMALCEDCRTNIGGQDYCSRCKAWFDFPMDLADAVKKFFTRGSKCPNCGKGVEDDFIICPYCQAKLKAKCARCGQLLEENWVACPYCGQPRKDQ